jgi:activating signal cointegrator 1
MSAMKALTLTEPWASFWASLVRIGEKRIETRSWRTSYRGHLAIHAGKGFPRYAREFAQSRVVLDIIRPHFRDDLPYLKQFPLGSVIATCRLISCIPTREIRFGQVIETDADSNNAKPFEITPSEWAFGNYDPGRWAWLLADIKPLAQPISAKGSLSLWDWEGVAA